ncbi:MAG: diacylglycerol/lipid kinase family protein [Candidatus Sulfotelmatobacter sp.]
MNSANLIPHMRAAAILGLGCSTKDLKPFQADTTQAAGSIEWRMGMPAVHDQADVILVFGGDGTIHRHLGQLVRLGLPVLVVPAGSGNDFARALGLRRVGDALAAWQRFCGGTGNVREIDLGVISAVEDGGESPAPHGSRYFCCVAGVGLDGEVARRANRLPRWLRGHGGYVATLIPTIFRFAPLSMKILTAEDPVEGDSPHQSWTARSDQPTLLAAFANAPVYGGGMKIAPQAKMDDGLLDVCIVAGVDPFKLFCLFPTVYAGRHLTIKEVEYFHANRVRVETERPLDVYADGEYVCRTPVEVAVQGSALKVVTL